MSCACPKPLLTGDSILRLPPQVLTKEAAYNAAGVGAYELHDYIDFRAWYHAALLRVRAAP